MASIVATVRIVSSAILLCVFILAAHVVAAPRPIGAQQAVAGMTPIYDIQGDGEVSPLVDARVDTYGVVTGLTPDGFYLQDPQGDGDTNTSDGIYVYTYRPPASQFPAIDLGSCLVVRDALVQEYYGKTELNWVGDIVPSTSCGGHPVTPVNLKEVIPAEEGDLPYERREGMLVELEVLDGVVHGPTKHYASGEDEIAYLPLGLQSTVRHGRILRSDAADAGLTDAGATVGAQPGYAWPGDALLFVSSLLGGDLPEANWGDHIRAQSHRPLRAILDYNFGKYQLLLLPTEALVVEPALTHEEAATPSSQDDFTVCTFNVQGLGRGAAQYASESAYERALARAADVIANALQGCTIVGLQETGTVEDARMLAARVNQEYGLPYAAVAMPGPMSSDREFPLTNSYLLRSDRVHFKSMSSSQACTDYDFGVVEAGEGACPAGQFPLFNRPPLVIDVLVAGNWGNPASLRLINNHWKSKAGDEDVNAKRRGLQAEHVAKLVEESRASGVDEIIVLGDLNDYVDSEPLGLLAGGDGGLEVTLTNVWNFVTPADAYSYIFNGISQVLDHILISPDMVQSLASVDVLHIHADFATCSPETSSDTCRVVSDHDPLMIRLRPGGAASVGGDLGYAGVHVELESSTTGEIMSAVSDADGGFRIWDVPPGPVRIRYHVPEWLRMDEGAISDGDSIAEMEARLANGFTELDTPSVRLVPAIRAADAASTLADALSENP